jgi:hypothetical protein
LNNIALADSVSELAIEFALSTYKPELILKAYNNYIANNDLSQYKEKALKYALAAKQLSQEQNNQKWSWKSAINLSKVYLAHYDYSNALISAYSAFTIARDLDDQKKTIESYLMIGKSLEDNNQKIEAFRNYLSASNIAEQIHDQKLLIKCDSSLSDFYLNTKIFRKAADYKLKEKEFLLNETPIDSLALMWVEYQFQVINLESNETRINEAGLMQILHYANRNNQLRLKAFTLSLYRSILIKLNRIDLLKKFYTVQQPDEFANLRKNSPSFYFRLKAFFSEEENQIDSAKHYFNKAGELICKDPNKILRSHFHLRYGQFFIRTEDKAQAIIHIQQAYDLAEETNYLDFMLESSLLLEKLYAEESNFREAYHFSSNSRQLKDKINKLAEKGKLLMLEINHETQQREIIEKREKEETLRRHNIQYTAIVIGILIVFLLLILLGSVKVPKWSIQALGFFSFIFLFEFIILLADHKIHHLTHGEPWKMLGIKVVLIGILLPFHHWIEHKVVHYLIHKELIRIPVHRLRNLFKKRDKDQPEEQ